MNWLTRGLVVVVLSFGLFGVSGCAEDNETEAQKLAKTAGDPGAAAPPKAKAAAGSELPSPTSSDEAFKRTANPGNMPSDYPGASKKKG